MLTPDKLFEAAFADKWPAVFCLQGNDDYLRRELRDLLRKQGFDIQYKDMKRKGPESEDEDLSCSTSLFQPRSFVWLETHAQPDRWSEGSKRVWARMVERADGQGLVLCVHVSNADSEKKGGVTPKKGVDTGTLFRFEVLENEKKTWLERMNRSRGGKLGKPELAHLLALDTDLMNLDQLVELWTLGGDTWAKIGVSYVPGEKAEREEFVNNPAYAWVDSFLEGHPEKGMKMLSRLLKDGQDPLPLIGLLSKTLRIWATLESGSTPRGEAPFLVDKVRRAMSSYRPRKASGVRPEGPRGARLLQTAAEVDLWLKSRPVDAEGLLVRLTASSF
jgi:DNA polymerase III delta subunit